jgi:hypothetical protein
MLDEKFDRFFLSMKVLGKTTKKTLAACEHSWQYQSLARNLPEYHKFENGNYMQNSILQININ